jgi:hypothetical protein
MTARRLAAPVALALALAGAAGPAHALDFSAVAGAGYFRSDSSTPQSSSTASTWDWYGNAALSGSPFAPGLLDWQLEGGYQGRRDYYQGGDTRLEGWGFHAGATLLGQKGSPLVFRLEGSRARSEFTSDTQQLNAGSTETTSWGGSAYYRELDRPNFSASFDRTETDTRGFGLGSTFTNSSRLGLAVAHGAGTFDYALNYDLSWNDGTFDVQNYRTQQVTLRGRGRVSPTADVVLSESYYQRRPTGASTYNPQYDDQAFSLQLNWRPGPRWSTRTIYGYQHFVVEDAATRERLSNALTESVDYSHSAELKAIGTAGVTSSEERAGGVTTRATSAFGSAEALWNHEAGSLTWQADGTLSAGVLVPDGASASGASGVSVSGGVRWARDLAAASGSYLFAYDTNLGGFSGWALRQQLQLDGELHAGDDWRLRASGTATGGRADLGAAGFGTSNRQLLLTLGADWRGWSSLLTAGQNDGISGDLRNPLRGDGLFLSPSYNSAQRYATLTLNPPAWEGLRLSLVGRYFTQATPGQPDQFERGFSVIGSYAIGAFNVSLEERWSQGGAGQVDATGNLLMVRVSRAFGARF